jgi:hypothetical protein
MSIIAALTVRPASAYRTGQDDAPVDETAIDEVVDTLAALNTRCKYTLERAVVKLPRAEAYGHEATRHLLQLICGLPTNEDLANANISSLCEEIRDWMERGQRSVTTHYQIAYSPGLTVQQAGPPFSAHGDHHELDEASSVSGPPSMPYVTPGVIGIVEGTDIALQYFPDRSELSLVDPLEVTVAYGLPWLLRPIPIRSDGLRSMRSNEWHERLLEFGSSSKRVVECAWPGGQTTTFQFCGEVPFPESAYYRSGAGSLSCIGLYRYGFEGAPGDIITVTQSIVITIEPHSVIINIYDVRDLEYNVSEEDLKLKVSAGTRLFDIRRPTHAYLREDPTRWPPAVLGRIQLMGAVGEAKRHEPLRNLALAISGLVLIVLGISSMRRKSTNRRQHGI